MNMKKYIFTAFLMLFLAIGQTALAALSAIVTVAQSPVTINQQVTANVNISNTGGTALTLTSLFITASASGSPTDRVPAAYSKYNFGPNATQLVIPANGNLIVPMNANFFSPSTGITGAGSGVYTIGATFTTSDGSLTTSAVGGNVTVNPVLLPASERQ
jgi:hypothetical protein